MKLCLKETQPVKCAIKEGFRKSGHIYSLVHVHKFAKVYSVKCILSSNSPKFAPAKVSLCMVFLHFVRINADIHKAGTVCGS